MMTLSLRPRCSMVRSAIGPINSWMRAILDADAFDAGKGLAARLQRAVDQIVVVLIGDRPVAAGQKLGWMK